MVKKKQSYSFFVSVAMWIHMVVLILCLNGRVWAQVTHRQEGQNTIVLNYELKLDSGSIIRKIRAARLSMQTNADSSIRLYQDALLASRRAGFSYGIQLSMIGLGVLYMDIGDYPLSRKYLQQVLYSKIATNRKKLLPSIYVNLSRLNAYEGNYALAYRFLDSALYSITGNGLSDSAALGTAYSNMSSILKTVGETNKALTYLKRAEHIAKAIKDTGLLTSVYNGYANVHKELGQYSAAMKYSNHAIELNGNANNIRALVHCFAVKATIFISSNDDDSARIFFEKALAISDKYNPQDHKIRSFIFLSLGELYTRRKAFGKAEAYLNPAMELALRSNNPVVQYKGYRALALLEKEMGDQGKAYDNLLKAHVLYDTILNIDSRKSINELETKYRTSEKDNQIVRQRLQLLQKEQVIQKKNFWIYGVSAASLLSAVFIFMLYYHRRRLQREKENNAKKDQEINQFKDILQGEERERSRIAKELHDGIISQLTAVKLRFSPYLEPHSVFDRKMFEQGYRYLDETMQDLRKAVHNMMPEAVVRSGLIGALSDFCNKMDNENATRIHFMTTGYYPLDKTLELSLYRMVQELVQNALKYANAHLLLVQLNYYDQLLEITIEDDGVGFDRKQEQNGTGLNNIRGRVAILDGHMEILSQKKRGTTVYMEIPIIKGIKSEIAYDDKGSYNR